MSLDILNEAFKRLNLLEDTFDTSLDGINKLSQFIENDDYIDSVDVIDDTAESEEELSDSYVGKVIIECNVCHSLIFKEQTDISINEEGVVNAEEQCPYCGENEGFVVVGKIEDYDEEDASDADGDEEDTSVDDGENTDEEADDGDLQEALGISAGLAIDRSKFKRRIRESVEENPLKNIRSNVIEFPNGEYVYIEYKNGKIVAGSATNNGIIPEYEIDYDNSASVDANIQNLYDVITEKNPDLLNEAIKNPDATREKVRRNDLRNSDSDVVRDLTLIIENDGNIYRRFTTPVIDNLKRKHKNGNYDEELAVQAFYNVVVNALKTPQFNRDYTYSIKSVGVPERYAVAKNLLSYYAPNEIKYEGGINEAVDVTDQVTISTKESGFITKKKDLEAKGYKVIGTGNGQIIMAKPKAIKEGKETLPSSFSVDTEIIEWVDLSDEDEVKDAITDFMAETYGVEPVSFDIDVNDDYVDVINIKWGVTESRKPKAIKEGLSYGELTAIESEWNKFKKSKGINGKAEADVAWEFIDTECKGVYDTEDERNEVFGVIGSIEEGGLNESTKLVEKPIYDLTDDEIEFLNSRKTTRVNISDREASLINARRKRGDKYVIAAHGFLSDDVTLEELVSLCFKSYDDGTTFDDVWYSVATDDIYSAKMFNSKEDACDFIHSLEQEIDTEFFGYDYNETVEDYVQKVSSVIAKRGLKESTLNEEPYLEPRYDARQSFYNKAFVTDDENDLYSYGLKVMTIKDGQPIITCPVDRISQTTLRHIKEFLLQNGFKAINKAQILRDYKQEVPTRDIKIDECNKPMNEDVRDSHYRDYIYDYFEFSTDDKFLDLIADLLDRVDDFSNEQEVWEAVDSGMIYTQDQWTAYMHYCDMGDPAENMWEGLMGDMLAICSKIADNDTEDDDDEPMDESLKESYMRKWKKRFTEGINNATVETDDSKLTMSADENGKVTVTTEPIDNAPVEGEAVAPLDDGEIDALIDASAESVDEPVEDELGEEEIDFDIEEVDEESLDDLGESYMKKIYENVDSFKTTKVHTNTDRMIVEGVIKFKSGKSKKTGFIFEAHNATKDGRVKFLGENKHFSNRRGAFTLNGVVKGKKLIAESLAYNYKMGKKDTVKGSVKRSK